ncbi:hypothetical protein EIP86_010589 [Pleurotus ostreatoroseus]|nr:hypothetical protein EIP86_010589 [Pleurotus ostreatoroseus]
MPPFARNPLNPHPIHTLLRKHPSLFGIPFLIIIVGASFGLQSFTQTRYDLQDKKVQKLTKEQELGLVKSKRKIDIREEYFVSSPYILTLSLREPTPLQRLSAGQDEDWDPNKRIPRPEGLPEWGVPPTEPPPQPNKSS